MISQYVIVNIMLLLATKINSETMQKTDCPISCGNLSIAFPFGTTSDCCLDDSFLTACNHSYSPPKPSLNSGSIEVYDTSRPMKVSSSVASDCYGDSCAQINGTISELTVSKFPIANKRNKPTANDTHLRVEGFKKRKQMRGTSRWTNLEGYILVDSSNYCDYDLINEIVRLSVERSANMTCEEAQKNLSSYACRAIHSECGDSENGFGYRWHYFASLDSFQDSDERATLKLGKRGRGNLVGSYSCSRPQGFEGDGKKYGTGCHPKSRKTKASTLFYIACGFIVPAVGSLWIIWRSKQKKVIKLRQNLFKRNGGLILENKLAGHRTLQVFTAEDLKEATQNYKETGILYRDEFREITYKGVLSDPENSQVTIQKCFELEECESSDIVIFINKLVTLSRFNHKNVVKLIGCCLETQVPLLVYESIDVKTLYDCIHDDYNKRFLSWDIRLRIATETARALAYLHSAASQVPIIHGNLNSYSIMLGHDYAVKLHDFGLTNRLSGFQLRHELGYLDPELFSSHRLTVKSDVYSFGVVLAELLTGKKVISFERLNGEEHLSKYFVSLPRGDDLLRIFDQCLVPEDNIEQLTKVAKLAQRCLSNSSVERPTTEEVVIALKF